MPMFQQLTLPGMPVRLLVSAIWEGPDRPCTIRATLDTPSDQFTSQIVGHDVVGTFTSDELADAMATLVYAVCDPLSPVVVDIVLDV